MTTKQPNSSYMGSGLAQTVDPKGSKPMAKGLNSAASATSLTPGNYAVPSLDGKLLPATPINLALKFRPPTIAVVYQMKDHKTGRMKKYIHDIKINFDVYITQGDPTSIDLGRMCEEVFRKETTYLNPAIISRKQITDFLTKLHQHYMKSKGIEPKKVEGDSAGKPAQKPEDSSPEQNNDTNTALPGGRKPNFFDRKRFKDYEPTPEEAENNDEDNEADDGFDFNKQEHVTKEVKAGKMVEQKVEAVQGSMPLEDETEDVVMVSKKREKKEAVRSAPPKKDKAEKENKVKEPEPIKAELNLNLELNLDNKQDKESSEDAFDDNYEDDWDLDNQKQQQKNVEQSQPQRAQVEQQKSKSSKQSDEDAYEEDWNMSDNGLELDNGPTQSQPKDQNSNNFFGGQGNVQNAMFDEIPEIPSANHDEGTMQESPQQPQIDFFGTGEGENPDSEQKQEVSQKMLNMDNPASTDNLFPGEFNDFDLENELNNDNEDDDDQENPMGELLGQQNFGMGGSITKELLQQTNKEIIEDDLGLDEDEEDEDDNAAGLGQLDGFNDQLGNMSEYDDQEEGLEDDFLNMDPKSKKNLQIDIDENADFDQQNDLANAQLNDKLLQNENNLDQNNELDGGIDQNEDDEEVEMTPDEIENEFDEIFQKDPQLQAILGGQPDNYSLEEKYSIVQAYKKGGGVEGLNDIIDEDGDEEEEQQMDPMSQQQQQFQDPNNGDGEDVDLNNQMNDESPEAQQQQPVDDEEVDIDLEDPEDIKIIEQEFQKLYDNDENFRNSFGEEAFELGPVQKYQIIDAYNNNGMEAVLNLLTNSADQSGIMQQMDQNNQQSDNLQMMAEMGEEGEESVIEHEGKKYNRIQIEGLGEDEEYLMDEKGDVYTQDFKYLTNIGENCIIDEN